MMSKESSRFVGSSGVFSRQPMHVADLSSVSFTKPLRSPAVCSLVHFQSSALEADSIVASGKLVGCLHHIGRHVLVSAVGIFAFADAISAFSSTHEFRILYSLSFGTFRARRGR